MAALVACRDALLEWSSRGGRIQMRFPLGLIAASIACGSLLHRLPGMVRVEAGDRQRRLAWNRRNIFLIDHAVLIHHKRVNSGRSIFGGPRHQTEPANKFTFNQVIVRSLRRISSLSIENAEIVSVVGFGLSLL